MGRSDALAALRKIIDRQQETDFAGEIAASSAEWERSALEVVRDEWVVEGDDGAFALYVRRVIAWRRADNTPIGSFTWDREAVLNPLGPAPQERLLEPNPHVRVDGRTEPDQMLRYVFVSADDTYPGLWKRIA